MELEGKEIGCWCKPSPCHGDILIKLFKERQGINPCSSRSAFQELTPTLTRSGRNRENDDQDSHKQTKHFPLRSENDYKTEGNPDVHVSGFDVSSSNVGEEFGALCLNSHKSATSDTVGFDIEEDASMYTPLRLNGGVDTSFETQEAIEPGCTMESDVKVKEKAGLGDSSNITVDSECGVSSHVSITENAFDVLKDIRIKNVNRIVVGTLNINSLAPKFDQLSEVIGNHLDALTIQETK